MTTSSEHGEPRAHARIHPLIAAAAVSVIALSLTGVAALTGLIGHSKAGAGVTGSAPTAASAQGTAIATPMLQAPAPAAGSIASTEATRSAPVPPAARTAAQTTKHHPATRTLASRTPAAAAAPVGSADPVGPTASAGGAWTPPPPPVAVEQARPPAPDPRDWGTVESVREVQVAGAQPSGVGAVAGGVIGGVLGNQIGHGTGRALGTIAGLLGGGFAGNEIEKRTSTTTRYAITVRVDDGSVLTFTRNAADHQVGERVRLHNGQLSAPIRSVPSPASMGG